LQPLIFRRKDRAFQTSEEDEFRDGKFDDDDLRSRQLSGSRGDALSGDDEA